MYLLILRNDLTTCVSRYLFSKFDHYRQVQHGLCVSVSIHLITDAGN